MCVCVRAFNRTSSNGTLSFTLLKCASVSSAIGQVIEKCSSWRPGNCQQTHQKHHPRGEECCGGDTVISAMHAFEAVWIWYEFVCVCVLGAGEGGQSVKAWIYSKGGGEQHQRAQRTTGPAHKHWNLVRAEPWREGVWVVIQKITQLTTTIDGLEASVEVLWFLSFYLPLLAIIVNVLKLKNPLAFQREASLHFLSRLLLWNMYSRTVL